MNKTTRTPRKPQAKQHRGISVLARRADRSVSHVRIVAGKDTDDYGVAMTPVADGVHVRLAKLAGDREVYDLLISPAGSECDCKGFTRWSHCKHCDGVFALLQSEQQKAAPVCSTPARRPVAVGA